jgi:ATP-binding cassette subfamily C protein
MKKYPWVRQHSEEDCGAACLATVSKYYGRYLSLNSAREAVGTGIRGSNMLGIARGAESLGFNTRSLKASLEILNQLSTVPLPAIIHWNGCHFVVLYGRKGSKFIIADPAVGIRYLSQQELVQGWTNWAMVLLQPDYSRFNIAEAEEVKGFSRFARQIWPYRSILIIAILCSLTVGLISIVSPLLIKYLTDEVLIQENQPALNRLAIVAVIMNVISSTLGLIQSNLIAQFAQRLELGFILQFARQILRLPLNYFESRRSGEILSRLEDIQEINQLILQAVIGLPSQFFIMLVSVAVMLFYSVKLAVVAIAIAFFVMPLSTIIFLHPLQQYTRRTIEVSATNQGILVELFKGAATIKANAAAPQIWEELQGRFGKQAKASFSTAQVAIFNGVFANLVSGAGGIVLLWLGGSLVISQHISIGTLLAFNSMNGNLTGFVSSAVSFVDEFTKAKIATERLNQVIDATPEVKNGITQRHEELLDDDIITCEKINFFHVGKVKIFNDLSLKLPGGRVTALVGRSGCGKSTLVKIIAGLHKPASGSVKVGLLRAEDLTLDCWRKQVVLVPQDAHFLSRSITENFRLGSPYISHKQIVMACQITGADEFIDLLPGGYDSILGEFGANLSGGQRQRLAIARAMVSDVSEPPILILDESTSALDPISEADVLERLLLHRSGKTTILISHRPKVVQRADWIIYMEKGSVEIQGTYTDLITKPGSHLDFLIS